MISDTNPSATPSGAKWSFGKTLLILSGICSMYAWLIPTRILTEHPSLIPFVAAMENILPAIKGFARVSPVPEVVRFYYATMWIAFPVLYFFVRLKYMVSFASGKKPKNKEYIKIAFGIFVCVSAILLVFAVIGLHDAVNATVKPIAIGGRGNALFIAMAFYPVMFGIASAIMWIIIAVFIEVLWYCGKFLVISS